MNRKRLIVGLVSLAVLVLLVIGGIGWLFPRLKTQPAAHQRTLISKLVYCGSQDIKPCIVSFSIDAAGTMLVNLVIPSKAYPYFYLTISKDAVANRYECQQVEDFPTNIYCTGAEMYPGETLQFSLLSLKDDTVLAEGKFAIIGLMLPNPEEEAAATPFGTKFPAATEPPFETSTPFLLDFPTLEVLATPTPTISSYPNYP